jgi:hypothetical protein
MRKAKGRWGRHKQTSKKPPKPTPNTLSPAEHNVATPPVASLSQTRQPADGQQKAVRALTHNGGRGKKERASLRHSHNRSSRPPKKSSLHSQKSHSKLRHWIHAAANFTSIRTGASCDQRQQYSELQEKGSKRWQQRRSKRAPFLRGREEPGRIRTVHILNTVWGP